MTTTPMPTSSPALGDIERHARAYADAHRLLSERVQALQDDIEAARRRKLGGIRSAVARAAEARDRLERTIDAAPQLFRRPRTLVIDGVRVGFAKGKGAIEFDDERKVIGRIRKHFDEDRQDLLIKTTERLVKKAVSQLSAAELKRIGVEVRDAGDQVVIKPTDDQVDKIVAALLKEADAAQESAP